MAKLKVAFIGQNGQFSVVPLQRIAERHELVAIIYSQGGAASTVQRRNLMLDGAISRLHPQKRKHYRALERAARSYGIPFFVLTVDRQDELIAFLQECKPDVLCVAVMNHLLRADVLKVARLGAVNLHPSLLPSYRGPFPWFWQYYYMELIGGVTAHFLDAGEDSGNILRQVTYEIKLGMPFEEMLNTASNLAGELILAALEDVSNGAQGTPQHDIKRSFRSRRIEPNEQLIDWQGWPIERVWHVLRGTQRWLKSLPPRKLWGGETGWKIGELVRESTAGVPGTLARDSSSYYIVHPNGKIRLAADYSTLLTRAFWLACYREERRMLRRLLRLERRKENSA